MRDEIKHSLSVGLSKTSMWGVKWNVRLSHVDSNIRDEMKFVGLFDPHMRGEIMSVFFGPKFEGQNET